MNFGLTLSIWDYLFRTAYIPQNGKNIEIGFEGDEDFPQGFGNQLMFPFKKSKNQKKSSSTKR
jgi:sterol desaturase/sphingolipid hydroxylase (fatty acid hydroxylase superfamily)